MESFSYHPDPQAPAEARAVLDFWLTAGPDRWFARDEAFDLAVRERFAGLHDQAAGGRLSGWEESPQGALALLVLLDQAPRNMYRGDPGAFATDEMARAVAERAISRGFDHGFPTVLKRFFYLPFMHSESLADQERCVALCAAAGDEEGRQYAEIHADVIRQFGRFPHRNPALGRETTDEERGFLASGGFAG
jgi:uncharacterized protein (DUF924 family)